MTTTIWLETELIFCKEWTPSFVHLWQKTSSYLLQELEREYGAGIRQVVKPELDSCQIEIINKQPYHTIDQAIKNIQETMKCVLNAAQKAWLHLPDLPYGTICEDITYSDGIERYKHIHHALLDHCIEARNGTNICGTHINISTPHILTVHSKISTHVAACVQQEKYEELIMHPVRYAKYTSTVQYLQEHLELGTHISPLGTSVDAIHTYLLDSWWRPFSSYELVRLKQLVDGRYLSELRTIDWPTGYNPLTDFKDKTMKWFNELILPHL